MSRVLRCLYPEPNQYMSNEKSPGCLRYIGDYTTVMWGLNHYKDPYQTTRIQLKMKGFFSWLT